MKLGVVRPSHAPNSLPAKPGNVIGEALAGRSSSKGKEFDTFQDIGYGWMMDGCSRYRFKNYMEFLITVGKET